VLRQMQEDLPEEIKQARWIVKDREELLGKARAEGEKLVEAAREEQLRMARKESIVVRANEEGERILTEAEDRARIMRDEAEDYVDSKLAQFEIALRKVLEESQAATKGLARTLDQVEMGRDRLRAPATAAEEEFGTREPAPRKETPFYDEEER
jgi:F0F1-type ATP synthase membrane subunit b/b'